MAVNIETKESAHAAPTVPVTLYGRELVPNKQIPLNLDWVEEIQVNTSAVERRAATIGTRRSVKKDYQAAWLLRAIACMDLTTLAGDDSAERVKRLCAKARRPLEEKIVKALGIESLHLTTGAVCVYHTFVETAVKALEGSGVPVAAVSTGFLLALRRSKPASKRFAARWKPARAKSISSSRVRMFSTASGMRCTTKSRPLRKPAARRI